MRSLLPLWLYLVFGAVLIACCQFGLIGPYFQLVIMYGGINVMLCASLNLINGYMGEFSCGHAGFMAVGAYVSSLLNMWLLVGDRTLGGPLLGPAGAIWLFPMTLLAGGAAAALVGLLVAIPSFRTRGDYLAIITLAVNYIIKSVIENIQTIGGARGFMGMQQVVKAMRAVLDLPWVLIWIMAGAGLTVWLIHRLISSTYGKGIVAVRDDEVAAELMGVNTRGMKLIAFMLSSGLAGMAGGLFAHVLGYINPGSFTIMKSTEIMVMVYLGGMGSLSGSVMSALFFTGLMELLRPLQVLKWVLIPLLLIILMLFRPEGLMGHRELTDLFPRMRRLFAARPKEG